MEAFLALTQCAFYGEIILCIGACLSNLHWLIELGIEKCVPCIRCAREAWRTMMTLLRALLLLAFLCAILSNSLRAPDVHQSQPPPRHACHNFTADVDAAKEYDASISFAAENHEPLGTAQREFLPGFLELYSVKSAMSGNLLHLNGSISIWAKAQKTRGTDSHGLEGEIERTIDRVAYDLASCLDLQPAAIKKQADRLFEIISGLLQIADGEKDFREGKIWKVVGQRTFLEKLSFNDLLRVIEFLREGKKTIEALRRGLVSSGICLQAVIETVMRSWNATRQLLAQERDRGRRDTLVETMMVDVTQAMSCA